jgi:hypothetical protein
MRIAFLVLAAVNLLFLAWAHWVDSPGEATASDGLSRLPRLQLATEAPTDHKGSDGAVQKMALRQPEAAQSCKSVGPFSDTSGAARAAAVLADKGFTPQQRSETGEVVEGYWVYLTGMKNDDEVTDVVDKLGTAGFVDAHVMKASATERRVSVGLFGKRDRADRRAWAVQHSLGIQPEIGEKKTAGTLYWVDVVLKPGMPELSVDGIAADPTQSKVGMQECPAGHATARPKLNPTLQADAGPEESNSVAKARPEQR